MGQSIAVAAGGRAATPSVTYRASGDQQGRVDGVRKIVADIWHSRELVAQLVLRDVRIRYKQAVMGFGWAVFMPMLVVLSGMVVRYAMAQASGRALVRADLGAIAVKALPWAFFVGAIGLATQSLISNMNLLTKIYFPREVLPVSATLGQAFDTSIGLAALALALPFLGAQLTPQLLWVPPLLAVLFLFVLACAVFLSCANLFFRDVKYIVQVLLTFGIFVAPVFYDTSMFGPTISRVLMLNPLAPVMEGLRYAVIDGHNLLEPLVVATRKHPAVLAWSPWHLVYSATWAVLGLYGSLKLFRRASGAFAEWV